MKKETVKQFLARGGEITKLKPEPEGPLLTWDVERQLDNIIPFKPEAEFTRYETHPNHQSLVGKVFGPLTVVGYYKSEHKTVKWRVRCECGAYLYRETGSLKRLKKVKGKVYKHKCREKK